MKSKIFLSALVSMFLCIPVYSKTIQENNQLSTSQFKFNINGKDYPLEHFTGEYDLLGYKVDIKLKSSNTLSIIFKNLPEVKIEDNIFDDIYGIFKTLEDRADKSEELKKVPIALNISYMYFFPLTKEYSLAPVGGLTFIIQKSGGYSIEFINVDLKDKIAVLIRDLNGNFLSKEDLDRVVYREEISRVHDTLFSSKENKLATQDEISSTKANMHTLKTMVETYCVDWGGIYPTNLTELYKEADNKKYLKEFRNPYTSTSGLGKNLSMIDFKEYKNYKPHPSLKGLVLYDPQECSFNKQDKKNQCSAYKIYGTDRNGELIKDEDGNTFYLINY